MCVFAHLSISEADRPARSVAVGDIATIGRAAENDIVLEAATVSRYHALLLRDAAGLLLVDLESANGTLLNGVFVRLDEPVRLTVVNPRLPVRQVITSAPFTDFLAIHADLDTALAALAAWGRSVCADKPISNKQRRHAIDQ